MRFKWYSLNKESYSCELKVKWQRAKGCEARSNLFADKSGAPYKAWEDSEYQPNRKLRREITTTSLWDLDGKIFSQYSKKSWLLEYTYGNLEEGNAKVDVTNQVYLQYQ